MDAVLWPAPFNTYKHPRYTNGVPSPRLAFLILAHDDAPQLERLCLRLHPYAVFVHIDAKAKSFPVDRISALPHVTVVTVRTAVYWGDFSMVEATLSLLTLAYDSSPYERFVLISGACYPVKKLATLEEAHDKDSDKEWIALTEITPNSHLHSLIARRWRMAPFVTHPIVDGRVRALWNRASKIIGRSLESEIGGIPYFGSQWWALTSSCVAMILEFCKDHPSFMRAYQSVYAPDEHFFHTIVGNSKYGRSALFVSDRGSATNASAPLHLIAPTEDRYFGSSEADFALAANTDKLFIRKVSTGRSLALVDRIDGELLGTRSSNPATAMP